ncbi:MAG: hypothetical protein JOZ70_07670 [Pseudolabrys sp.]|nr:hypothetical protein [Pseudolabrys sp.]MBV9955113.1 hypothetical protein [Pseudolabrys sp.]
MSLRHCVTVLALIFLFAAPLGAAPRDALETFGFTGEWALRCDAPPALDNPHRIIRLRRSGSSFTEQQGEAYQPNEYRILAARRDAQGALLLRVRFAGATQELTIAKQGDQIRTMRNRDVASGRLVVDEGVVASNGAPTPWLTRCGPKEGNQ